jgi:hypothetical protein
MNLFFASALFDPAPERWFGELSLVSGGRAVYKAATLLVFSGEHGMPALTFDARALAPRSIGASYTHHTVGF